MAEETGKVETERPRVVSVAGLLLLMLPLIGVIGVVLGMIAVSMAQDNAARLVTELGAEGVTDARKLVDTMISGMWLQTGGTILVRLLQAIAMAVLAFFVLRGSRAARITVFVLAGLSVLAVICVGVLTGVLQKLRGDLDRLSQRAGFRAINETDVLPGWFQPVNYALLGLSVAMILAAVVLLTRPAANAYFHRGRPAPQPPPLPGGPPPQPPSSESPDGPPPPGGSLAGDPQQSPPPDAGSVPRPVGEQAAAEPAPAGSGGSPAFIRRAAVVLVVVIALVGVFFTVRGTHGIPRPPTAVPAVPTLPPDKPHDVVYVVEIFGPSSAGMMSYSKAEGVSATESIPDNLPAYSGTSRFSSSLGVTVFMTASVSPARDFPASAIIPKMRCSIHVDGVISAIETGSGFCTAMFRLDDFTGVPIVPTRDPSSVPDNGCGYVDNFQVADVVADATGHKRRVPRVVVKPNGYCNYEFAARDNYVRVKWNAGRKLNPAPGEKIIMVDDVRAIWNAEDKGMQFEFPSGVLWLQADMPVSDKVAQRIVVDLFDFARPLVR
ncbi:hypothetical protein GCM10010168_79270 [Actinoplanes ianthinogenes]|uniref:Uncharacterized protein n=1 Tax=Actinoplanes ianthinogenes TaxID=122358 RepID=A0ABM7LK41_9ACTN|nr:hypothetical protein [Actinoplanes ianthinogenes]BCJ39618.1 hypothetical protein Aiant_02750 [Actinoplanes ianthinogenes]GGR48519.1 hypothetical protein GCM10010168_79270 [Actinoplanes ianthinogenes]